MVYKPNNELDTGKKQQVESMFDQIAAKYDFLNHFLSFGIDYRWRRKSVKLVAKELDKNPRFFENFEILDLATGTGDFALAFNRLSPNKIVGVDLSAEMLKKGQEKIGEKKIDNIQFQCADAENLPFPPNRFHLATVAFGIRNFEDLRIGLQEIFRVLKNGGLFLVLEFSMPSNRIFKALYSFYFSRVLPFIGKMVSKSNYAYTYLPNSVKNFPEKNMLIGEFKDAGFKNIKAIGLTGGTATIYLMYK